MTRQVQLGVRKNPAPHARQHGLCLAADLQALNGSRSDTPESSERLGIPSQATDLQNQAHAAPMHAATAGETPHSNRLLTVNEVADLLHVPASWVYGRTRKRSVERLPGYRLGKYWRFSEAEVLGWLQSQKHNVRAA